MTERKPLDVALAILAAGGYPTVVINALEWGQTFKRFEAAALIGAAEKWAREQDHFPAQNEFTVAVQGEARRLCSARAGVNKPVDGSICGECGGTQWVETTAPGELYSEVKPCRVCLPEQYAKQLMGSETWTPLVEVV